MKFFVDTADVNEIRDLAATGLLDGVTTNPSLMAKEGVSGKENVYEHYRKICEITDGDVSAEVISTDYDGILKEAAELIKIHKNIVVKIPMIKEGVRAMKHLTGKGIKVNCTLIFSAGQAILAAKAGATYISPFIGRLDDISYDGLELIEQIRVIYDNYSIKTQILAASVRHPIHIVRCAEIGADIATCPLSSILALLNHPLTDIGLQKFLADHKASQKTEKVKA